MTTFDFKLNTDTIKFQLDHLAQSSPAIKQAITLVGYPKERRNDIGYPQLLRIIAGQQLSVKAAASIWGRIEALMEGNVTPEGYLALSDQDLRDAGCSFRKIDYGKNLSLAVQKGDLELDNMPSLTDQEILRQITAIKGFGRWSAEMYMIFSLGRENIWPIGDLAVRKGIGRILGMTDDPMEKNMDDIGEQWHPYRTVVALLCWHFYANAPFIDTDI